MAKKSGLWKTRQARGVFGFSRGAQLGPDQMPSQISLLDRIVSVAGFAIRALTDVSELGPDRAASRGKSSEPHPSSPKAQTPNPQSPKPAGLYARQFSVSNSGPGTALSTGRWAGWRSSSLVP